MTAWKIDSEAEWEAFVMESGECPNVLYAEGRYWLLWETEHGDWYALRSMDEDDEQPGPPWSVGPVLVDSIGYPCILIDAYAIAGSVS